MTRKSGRVRASKAVYTEDPFAAAGISDDEENDQKQPKKDRRLKEESPSDDEFVGGDDDDDAEDDEMEDAAASEEGEETEAEAGAEAEEEEEEEEEEEGISAAEMEIDFPVITPKRKGPTVSARAKTRFTDGTMEVVPSETHYRGILDHNTSTSKFMHQKFAFGSDERDLIAAVYHREQWSSGRDACFPSRCSLERLEGAPDYKYGPTFGIDPDDAEEERTSGWDWYYDGDIGDRFQKRQRLEKLKKKTDINNFLAELPKEKHRVLIGPADQQTSKSLGYYEPYNYGQAWDGLKSRSSNQQPRNTAREGWLMSFGQKIQCMAWAPNQDGLSQYLAVVVPITEAQKKKYSSPDDEPRTAFEPAPSYPCALQLWEFKGKEGGSIITLDMSSKPLRRLVICSEWGDIRRIAWCPMAREKRPEDEQGKMESIGLLAGIWGDGKVRVLDIKVDRDFQQEEYVRITAPVFEAQPPSTVCSCVTWLSPSDIAVGCSDGHVAIWSILPSSNPKPQPYFYRLIHSTWVLSITSAYPTHPHLLSTISMDGETQLWSMIEPQGETSSTVRMRVAAHHVSYSPVLQSVISVDENDFGRMMPIRRFFASTAIGRLSSSAASLAPCSSWHPSILMGGTGGEVMATNPLRKLLHTKEQQWQQNWFTHDWVAGPKADSPGTSRFFDGYAAESQVLAKNLTGETRLITGFSVTTIHEEGTHVTALGWNPNRRCAAWAGAALGCGLLRVEDLAI